MGANLSERKLRDRLLSSPLADFAGGDLLAWCPVCRDWRTVRIDKLLATRGGHHALQAITQQLRCAVATCGRPPVAVNFRSKPDAREIAVKG